MIQKLLCTECASKSLLTDQDVADGWRARTRCGWVKVGEPYTDPSDGVCYMPCSINCSTCRAWIGVRQPMTAVTYWQIENEAEPAEWESEAMQLVKNFNCRGSHCTSPDGEVRICEVELILCRSCYNHEMRWRTQHPKDIQPLQSWDALEV